MKVFYRAMDRAASEPVLHERSSRRISRWTASASPADRMCFVSSNGWDAFAAKASGFRVVWCNRFAQPPERIPAQPDAEASTLAALPDLLGPGG